jgi:hypothetical protein
MRSIRNVALSLFFLFLLINASEARAQAEDDGLELRVMRIFGFRLGNTLQGRIGLRADGPEDLIRVVFYLDDEMILEDSEAPFQAEFSTGEFSPGKHTLQAIGYTRDGKTLESEVETYSFLSADEAMQSVQDILIPLLIGVVLLMAIAGVVAKMITKRDAREHKIGDYGAAGGAVCRRCGKPFSRHFLSPNLIVGKLERCPHCGAVGVFQRANPAELKAAEDLLLAEMGDEREVPEEESEEERLRRMLDETRFDADA